MLVWMPMAHGIARKTTGRYTQRAGFFPRNFEKSRYEAM